MYDRRFAMVDATPYVSRRLEGDRVDLIYPLIREVAEGLSIDHWRRFATHYVSSLDVVPHDRGIVVIEAPRAYMRGMFAYRVVPCLDLGRGLTLDCVAAPDSLDGPTVVQHLIAAVRRYARQHDCDTIDARLTPRDRWLADVLCQTGYREQVQSIYRFTSIQADPPG